MDFYGKEGALTSLTLFIPTWHRSFAAHAQ